jgi:hypothetical protein
MKSVIPALALVVAVGLPSDALAWGKDALTRASIIVASTVYVNGDNCVGWKVNAPAVMQAVQSNGFTLPETMQEPMATHVRAWLSIYQGTTPKSACSGILKSFGPKGGHVPGLMIRG